MELSQQGADFIKRWESCRLTPYQDVAGFWTVGWGHLMAPTDDHTVSLTQAEADALFDLDIAGAVDAVKRLVTIEMWQALFDCCVSLTHNIGEVAIERSTFLQYLLARQYSDAVVELLTWRKAGGRNIEGLLNRRAHEALVLARGEYT